ncbi:MAG TPA: BON domain-containing protein [Steroidobacteraceae bacterium]|jgi:osmotically-inducible protein OsmY|nr:BON domain-containing protein [Steroidobacteraceae bacterium]
MKSKLLMTAVAVLALGSLTAACTPTRTTKSAGEAVDDSVITAKVKTDLARDPKTSAYKIEVETFRGDVQLNGFVESAEMKTAATGVARSVKGVKKVENNLRIGGDRSAGEVVDDAVITTKVKTALAADPVVAAHEVNVQTHEGVVMLAGFVDTGAQKSKATEVTKGVGGVRQVDNQLEVKQR